MSATKWVFHVMYTKGHNSFTSTFPCTATTRHPAIAALHRIHRAPRLHVTRPYGLCINLVVHRDNSSPSCTASNAPMSCIRDAPSRHSTSHRSVTLALAVRLATASRLLFTRLHQLYCAYVVHLDTPSWRLTFLRSVALALAVRPVTPSHGSTASPLDLFSVHTGSSSAMPCAATTCLMQTPTLPWLRCASPRCRLPIASHRILISASFPT
jgi:hypothetical protein